MSTQATMMRSFVFALLMALLATSVRVDEDPVEPADGAADADAGNETAEVDPEEVDPEEAKKKEAEQEALVKTAGHLENAAKLSTAVSKKAVDKSEHQQKVLDRLAKEQAEALASAQKTKDFAIQESERAERAEEDKKLKDASYTKACKESKRKSAAEVVGRASAMAAAAAEAKVTEEYANVDGAEIEAESKKDTSDAKAEAAVAEDKKELEKLHATEHAAQVAEANAKQAAIEEQEKVAPMKEAQAARKAAKKTMRESAEIERLATEEAGTAKGSFEKATTAKKAADIRLKDATSARAVTAKKAAKDKASADEASEMAAAGAQVHAEREARRKGEDCALQQK